MGIYMDKTKECSYNKHIPAACSVIWLKQPSGRWTGRVRTTAISLLRLKCPRNQFNHGAIIFPLMPLCGELAVVCCWPFHVSTIYPLNNCSDGLVVIPLSAAAQSVVRRHRSSRYLLLLLRPSDVEVTQLQTLLLSTPQSKSKCFYVGAEISCGFHGLL